MKTFRSQVSLLAASLLLSLNFALASEPGKGEPPISVEQAIVLAKNYVKEHKIDVSKSYIGSAALNLNSRGDRGPFWLITWELGRSYSSIEKTAGGQIFLNVYMNQQIEVRYGE